MITDHFCREKDRDKRDAAWTGWERMGVKETSQKRHYYNTPRTFLNFIVFTACRIRVFYLYEVYIDS